MAQKNGNHVAVFRIIRSAKYTNMLSADLNMLYHEYADFVIVILYISDNLQTIMFINGKFTITCAMGGA